MPKKPIDFWLFIASLVAGIILYVLPKTPLVIIVLLTSSFLVLIHPVWNFWWIEKAIWRRILALGVVALALSGIGYSSWPIPPQQIAETKQPEIKPPPSPAISDSKPKPNKQAKPQPKPEPSKSQPPKPELPGASAQKQETPPPPIINAPAGIAIGGGTVINPTVNNFAPPDPNFRFLLGTV
jgi:hypothetical protein